MTENWILRNLHASPTIRTESLNNGNFSPTSDDLLDPLCRNLPPCQPYYSLNKEDNDTKLSCVDLLPGKIEIVSAIFIPFREGETP